MADNQTPRKSRFGIIRLFQITTVAAMIALCFMSLTRSCLGTYKFRTLPPDDQALLHWIKESEPNATVRVYRNQKRNLVTIERSVPLFAPEPSIPSPPWPELGYQSALSASLTLSVVDPYLPWTPIACGCLVLSGLWLLGRRQKMRNPQSTTAALEFH